MNRIVLLVDEISKEEFMLNLRYMMYLKPENEALKKVFSAYSENKKRFLPVDLVSKVSKSVGLTQEEFKIMRSIKTEEDLKKYCSH